MNGGAAVPKEASDLRAVDFSSAVCLTKKTPISCTPFCGITYRSSLPGSLKASSTPCSVGLPPHVRLKATIAKRRCSLCGWRIMIPFSPCPLLIQYFFNHQGKDIIQFFSRLFRECPPKTLLRHPLMVITVGIQFYKKGMREDYLRALQLMEEFFKTPPGPAEMPERELPGQGRIRNAAFYALLQRCGGHERASQKGP